MPDPIPIPKLTGPSLRCCRCEFWSEVPPHLRVKDTRNKQVCWGMCAEPEQQRILKRTNHGQPPPACYIVERTYHCEHGHLRETEPGEDDLW